MKKFLTLAFVVGMIAGTAMAQSGERFNIDSFASFPAASGAATGGAGAFAFGLGTGPTTTNNDDSCDVGTFPAATLLLPHFEVDFRSPATTAVNTVFSLVNTFSQPQIAHVTIWTDLSFPVVDFNIFLTGYDVQGISLYDIISRGLIPPTSSTTIPGPFSGTNDEIDATGGNPNFFATADVACINLPGPIPSGLLADIQNALTTGTYSTCGTRRVGLTHANAIGYVTIDVAATCSQELPITPTYFNTEILYDNTLTGDYQRINPTSTTGNFAGGNPLVHIRAIPEGGPLANATLGTPAIPRAGLGVTNLPFTFYDRYTPAADRRIDRRQPLPGTFAARFIQGGTGEFQTRYAIWREGTVGAGETSTCGTALALENASIVITELVRFDEQENPTTAAGPIRISPPPVQAGLPETSARLVSDTVFPPDFAGTADVGGWMFLNLNNSGILPTGAVGPGPDYSAPRLALGTHFGRSQNWVIVQMTAEGRYGVDFNATQMGNGCSAFTAAGAIVRPEANITP